MSGRPSKAKRPPKGVAETVPVNGGPWDRYLDDAVVDERFINELEEIVARVYTRAGADPSNAVHAEQLARQLFGRAAIQRYARTKDCRAYAYLCEETRTIHVPDDLGPKRMNILCARAIAQTVIIDGGRTDLPKERLADAIQMPRPALENARRNGVREEDVSDVFAVRVYVARRRWRAVFPTSAKVYDLGSYRTARLAEWD